MTNPPDYDYLIQDLREQLTDTIDTVMKLREQGDLIINKLLFLVDQGEGLTQDQLIEVYGMMAKLFPRRVRTAPSRNT